MLTVIGRSLMTVGTKFGYWGRLRGFATLSFNSAFKSYEKLKGKFNSSSSGAFVNKFLGSKYSMEVSGLAATEIAWYSLQWLIGEDEKVVAQGHDLDRLAIISTNYKADTFIKMMQVSLEEDETLKKRLENWQVKLFIVAGANDKSCRVLIKGRYGEPKVMSSFCVSSWINSYKKKGDLARLSDVLEWEFFHSFHQPSVGRNAKSSSPKSFRDNILISDKIDRGMIKASMAYSAILYDLLRLSKGDRSGNSLDISRLPTMKELNGQIITKMNNLQNDRYSNDAMKQMKLDSIIMSDTVDMSGISRSEILKSKILNSVANTDYQDAAILYLSKFMEAYSSSRFSIILPTKFNSEEFDDSGLRKADGYRAFIIDGHEDLDKLSSLLVDGRSKVSKSPGMNASKLKEFRQFAKKTVHKAKLAKSAASGDIGALDELLDSLTSSKKE